jgi:lipid-A-disaccharide synthase
MAKMVVKELIQSDLNAKNLSASLSKILENTNRERIQMDYNALKIKLGVKGASNKVADLIMKSIAE